MPNANESANHGVALEQARLLNNNWRAARGNQRRLAHALVLAVAVDGFAFGPMKDNIRDAMPKLAKEDAASLKTLFSDCGFIIDRWHTAPQEMKDAFIAGTLVYSTLKGDMRKAEKAKEKADAEAAERERLAELGIDADTDAANKAREGDALANVAAVERAIAMLANAERTDAENAALARLLDAVAAFQSATVEVAQAA